MQNSGVKTWRICARKLPPTLSEDEFLKTDLIANFITNKIISVKYYPAEAIGDTSAPASSMAIITITADDLTFKKFTDALSQQTFKMTYCEPKTAQIEFAPCQNLSVRYNQQQANSNARQMIPIDKDPEFIEFSSKFEESFTPPADAVLEKLEIDSDDQLNAERNLNIMSQKLNGGKIKNSGPNGPSNGPGGGKPKRNKNKNKKNRYTPGDGNHQ